MPHSRIFHQELIHASRNRQRRATVVRRGGPVTHSRAPILLHHGYTASRVNWAPVADRLMRHHQVILMECRGTGESEHTADGYTFEQYAADVIGLTDHLGVDRFTYAGHSMGGGIGYVLALGYPQRLERLILMASVPADGFPNSDPRMHEARAPLRTQSRPDNIVGAVSRHVCATATSRTTRGSTAASITSSAYRTATSTAAPIAMRDLAVGDRLASITMPTLIIAGSADTLLPANLEDFRRLPNAALQVFSRAGHDVAIHEPDGVADAIDAFVRNGLARPDAQTQR